MRSDAASFRVASLRNVELTAPYFHNGSAATLADAVQLYNRGGDFHANQAPNTGPRNYTQAEVDALVAVLRTLTDPRVAAGVQPFDRPLLGSQNGAIRDVARPRRYDGPRHAGRVLAVGPARRRSVVPARAHGRHARRADVPHVGHRGEPGTPVLWNVQLALTPSFQVLTTGPAQACWIVPYGSVQTPLPLPNTPSLSGQTFFAQWLVLEASQNWPARDVERAAHPAALTHRARGRIPEREPGRVPRPREQAHTGVAPTSEWLTTCDSSGNRRTGGASTAWRRCTDAARPRAQAMSAAPTLGSPLAYDLVA
jgi:hypothetical protein